MSVHFVIPTRRSLISTLALACVSIGSAHATNGYFQHGYGVQSLGMAGAGIALPLDALAGATNPAGTALLADRLDIGLTYFSPTRGASVQGNSYGLDGNSSGSGKRAFLIPEIGYVRHLDAQTTLGLSVYGNGGMNTQYDTNPFASLGGQGQAGVNLEQLFISPSLAFKITPTQSVGIAANIAYQRFSAQGLQPFTSASADPQHVTNQGTDTSTGAGVRLGWNGELVPGWRAGATWSSQISGRFNKYKGLFADQGSFDIPANYGMGLSYQPTSVWALTADYQVIQYSQVKAVANPLRQLFAGIPLGGNDGPGFGWKDVSVIKIGGQYAWNSDLTLRAGYSHATQPVPRDQTFINILAPGLVQDHVTAGFTWKASSTSEWSAYYAHAFNKVVKGQNSIPASFGGGEANIHLKETSLGLAYGWRF